MNGKWRKGWRRKFIQVLAILLVVFIVGIAILSSVSMAEGADVPHTNQCQMTIQLLEEQQALHITQRLVYYNQTGAPLNGVKFSLYANVLRREETLFYENESLAAAFPHGYVPGGIVFSDIRVNGESAQWGLSGDGEDILRVACALEPGEMCTFEFEYTLYLTANKAFIGFGETDWRVSGFCPLAAQYDDVTEEFFTYDPLQFTDTLFCPPADYQVDLILPENYLPGGTGACEKIAHEDGHITWRFSAPGAMWVSYAFSMRYRQYQAQTASGTQITVLANNRSGASYALEAARKTLETLENWFGSADIASFTICQSDYALDFLPAPGCVWINTALFESDRRADLLHALRFALSKQYFGFAVQADPVADAWLSDSLCEYLTYLLEETDSGYDSMIRRMNRGLIHSLQITVPGGLEITTSAAQMNAGEYEILVLDRGSAVLHELRLAMGRDMLLAGLKNFYDMRANGVLTEMDFVNALNAADGGSWYAFLTDWIFNIDQYTQQNMEWYE